MDCKKATGLVEHHLKFLATMEGEKVADEAEILEAFKHVKSCSRSRCSDLWHVVFRASRECSLVLLEGQGENSSGWDGDY